MIFGCHVSIKEGYLKAAKYAHAINSKSFQYFPKNPRSLTIKKFDNSDADQCREFCQQHHLLSVSHSPYPTNLVPSSKQKKKKVVQSLLNDLAISNACGSLGVVVHFGKQTEDKSPLASYQQMIETLNEILEQWDGECQILLENNAGKPGSIGTTLEELVKVRNLTDYPDKIGFCLDTCHSFASGLWNGDNWKDVVENGKKLGYFEHLRAIHLNNSKYPAGSGKDRHANIFEGGYIEENQWEVMMKSPLVKEVPLILETPHKSGITHEQELIQLFQKWPN